MATSNRLCIWYWYKNHSADISATRERVYEHLQNLYPSRFLPSAHSTHTHTQNYKSKTAVKLLPASWLNTINIIILLVLYIYIVNSKYNNKASRYARR